MATMLTFRLRARGGTQAIEVNDQDDDDDNDNDYDYDVV
jgi:hypothetical protein